MPTACLARVQGHFSLLLSRACHCFFIIVTVLCRKGVVLLEQQDKSVRFTCFDEVRICIFYPELGSVNFW